jgi:AcrR family transcriptional regulator
MQRRIPAQKRAEDTVDCLYEATARILEQGDAGRLTTNHIAEKAGVSIGTLYEYFPDKAGLLRAMAQRETKRQIESLQRSLGDTAASASPEILVRNVVRVALRPFANRSQVRMKLMRLLMRDPAVVAAARNEQKKVLKSLLTAISSRWPGRGCNLSEDAQFTLASAIVGASHAVALERPDYFETQDFEDEFVGLLLQRMIDPVGPECQ